ncbi:hypothetical protein HanIR_Chr02g0055371 [Helianthus annuus]|nr:hypothetical protein HanIR_Chr02g0055371 [Helianthus annuus]
MVYFVQCVPTMWSRWIMSLQNVMYLIMASGLRSASVNQAASEQEGLGMMPWEDIMPYCTGDKSHICASTHTRAHAHLEEA